MKGQKLFVRLLTDEDAPALEAFYARENLRMPEQSPGGSGFIGKVVGDVVAHLVFSVNGESMRVTHVFVSPSLRRKGVGRWLVREMEEAARGLRAGVLEASSSVDTDAFFTALGFIKVDGVLQKTIPT
jgi:N-acetylglutamate synthase-like GNAT family acetyltransferase